MLINSSFVSRVAIVMAVCACAVSSVMADMTFEFWDVVLHEAYARCEIVPFSGSAQLSEDDQWPDGWPSSIGLMAEAELGEDTGIDSYAWAVSSVIGDTYYDPMDNSYWSIIENEGLVQANNRIADTVTAETEAYFLLAMYVPVGEYYRYTIDHLVMETEVDPAVEFDGTAWHLTLNAGAEGGSTISHNLSVGTTGLLAGREDPYMLYGGFKFSAEDTSADGTDVYGWALQQLAVQFTEIPEPATISLLGLGALAMISRRKK